MKNDELYPDLKEYIFHYCGKYFWSAEVKAHRHLHALAKSNNGVNVFMYKFFMKEENVNTDKHIKKLVDGGFESFKERVVERIWNDHRHELKLNLCPRCSKVTRTPWAKQCQFCFHSWHRKDE
jgi:hypothetical protein